MLTRIHTLLRGRSAILLVILAVSSALLGAFFIKQVLREYTTPNYGFYGQRYDFLAFYGAAHSVLQGTVRHIYDMQFMTAYQRSIIPHPIGASGYMPFLNPPFLAVFLSPLALLPINAARILWLVINIFLVGVSIYLLTDTIKGKKRWLALLFIVSFPVIQSLLQGQVTLLVLFGCAVAYKLWQKEKAIWAGVCLLPVWIFPQFASPLLLALMYLREWRVLKGWLIATVGVIITTAAVTGFKVYGIYAKTLVTVAHNHFIDLQTSNVLTWRGNLDNSYGLNGFYSALFGSHQHTLATAFYVLSAAIIIGSFIYVLWRYNLKDTGQFFALSLCAVLLIDPHLFAQGIVLIFLLIPVLSKQFKAHKIAVLVGIVAVCNLTFIDMYSRVHFFTIALLIFFVYLLYEIHLLEDLSV